MRCKLTGVSVAQEYKKSDVMCLIACTFYSFFLSFTFISQWETNGGEIKKDGGGGALLVPFS